VSDLFSWVLNSVTKYNAQKLLENSDKGDGKKVFFYFSFVL